MNTGSAFRLALPAVVKAVESSASAPKPTPQQASRLGVRSLLNSTRIARLAPTGQGESGPSMLTATVAGPGSTYMPQNVLTGVS
jgi:hypothetical protein